MPKIQMRRDTAANWTSANPTLLAGEWALETDTKKMKIGDGTTAYNALAYTVDSEISSGSVQALSNQAVYHALAGFAPFTQNYVLSHYGWESATEVDATGLIRATAQFHEFTLDLSDNANLKTLTASGTASKLETGLTGVLVSNQAPFDQVSSPQLDVSYTGMSRSALVNLFKSMPYNVGYAVTGSPTITDGVASEFSNINFLSITNSTFDPSTDDFEINTKVKYDSSIGGNIICENNNNWFQLTEKNGRFMFVYMNTNTSALEWVEIMQSIQSNTDYWLRVIRNGTNLTTYYSLDGNNYIAGNTRSNVAISAHSSIQQINIGCMGSGVSGDTYCTGAIDLNVTSIKVNNIPWFRGKAAMTKTCSVVGCTGTADLTQTDKDIALDKGWSLTVA